jgi:dihydroorotate dehydrogenase
MYQYLLKPILFRLQPEKAHNFSMHALQILTAIPGVKSLLRKAYRIQEPKLDKNRLGLNFQNPVGLAAGFDKNASYIHILPLFGFSFIEVGTVTPKPQPGNDKPRLFRLPEDQALINRMGFNNDGLDAMVEKLKKRPKGLIIGGNIGKNKVTPNDKAVDDYLICFERLHEYVDYFVVNVSSPNTPGLRALQEKEPLKHILKTLQDSNHLKKKKKPILLKIAPDLNENELHDIIEIVEETQIEGVIATNTTIDRNNLKTSADAVQLMGSGGLSGKPVQQKATNVIQFLKDKRSKPFVIIGVGGIDSGASAKEKLDAGADLVQIYTGFIYQGPALVKNILKFLKNG